MSIARALLRIALQEALCPSALLDDPAAQFPTLAGSRVFNSRLDPLDDLDADGRRPSIAIYTDNYSLDRAAQSGPVFYSVTCDLVLVLSVMGKLADGDGEYAVLTETDSGVESQIDAMEWQVFEIMHAMPSGALFRKMAMLPALEWKSDPMRSGEEAVRMSQRTIRVRLRLRDFCAIGAPAGDPAGLDRLPPQLRDIAQALSGSAYTEELIAQLAARAPVMPPLPPLESVGLDLRAAQPPAQRPDPFTPHVAASAENLQD